MPRRQRLALVERLRAHFAHVVDAHQRRGMGARLGFQRGFGNGFSRRRPGRMRNAGDRSQRTIELCNKAIHRERLAEKKRAPEGARLMHCRYG
jgi:hypothetical protein